MVNPAWWTFLTRERVIAPGASNSRDVPGWVAWGSLAAAAALTVVVVWHSTAIVFLNDEVSTIGASRLIVHPDQSWQLGGASYLPGTALLLAPLWWWTDDPSTVYRLGVFILGAVSLALVWPLTRIAQEVGLSRNAGMTLGSIMAVAPDHLLLANYVWSEQLVALMVALAVWRGIVLAREWQEGAPSLASACWFGLAASGCYLAHGRTVVLAGIGGLALAYVALRRPRVGVPAVVAYAAVVVCAQVLFQWISSALYPVDVRTAETLKTFTDQTASEVAATGASQIWYPTVSWAGVFCIGLVALAGWARRGTHRVFARWMVGLLVATWAFFTLSLAGADTEGVRLDISVYGRYLAPFALPVAFIGLVAIVQGISRRLQVGAVALAASAAVAAALLMIPAIPAGGTWTTAHMPGVAFTLSPRLQHREVLDPWGMIVLILSLVAVLVIMVARRRALTVTAVGLALASVTLWSDQRMILEAERPIREEAFQTAAMEGIDPEVVLAGDSRVYRTFLVQGGYVFWAHPRQFLLYDSFTEPRPSDAVIGRLDWEDAHEQGALPLRGSFVEGTVVWVFPGALQERLLAEGRLFEDPYEALPGFMGFPSEDDDASGQPASVTPPG